MDSQAARFKARIKAIIKAAIRRGRLIRRVQTAGTRAAATDEKDST